MGSDGTDRPPARRAGLPYTVFCCLLASLHIEVHSRGGAGPHRLPSAGYGLRGLHERVHLVGGTLHAGPASSPDTPVGEWQVHAELPLPGQSAQPPPAEIEIGNP